MSAQTLEPKIYVACLAAYNNGQLHGAWIDAAQEPGAIRQEIAAMLRASPIPLAEEYAIHDYEDFAGAPLNEYTGIDEVAAIAALLAEHGGVVGRLIAHCGDVDSARTMMEDQYIGVYPSLAAFAEEITEETTNIPDPLRFYIDWAAMGRDLAVNDVLAIELRWDEVHLFWHR